MVKRSENTGAGMNMLICRKVQNKQWTKIKEKTNTGKNNTVCLWMYHEKGEVRYIWHSVHLPWVQVHRLFLEGQLGPVSQVDRVFHALPTTYDGHLKQEQ